MFAKAVLAVAGLLLVLTGCSSTLSNEDAGKAFLEAVCPANIANEKTHAANVDEDFEAYRSAAKEAAAAYLVESEIFTQTAWPDAVAPLIAKLNTDAKNIAAYYEDVSLSSSLEEARDVPAPDTSATGELAPKVREELGLSLDVAKSCASFN